MSKGVGRGVQDVRGGGDNDGGLYCRYYLCFSNTFHLHFTLPCICVTVNFLVFGGRPVV